MHIRAKHIAIWTATIILVLLGFEFLWLIRSVLFLMFLSILLATGIEPVVKWLRKGPFNKGTGILFVYTLIFGTIALLLFLTIPPLLGEVQRLIAGFTNPEAAKASISGIDNEFIRGIATQFYNAGSSILGNIGPAPDKAITLGLSFFESVFSGFTVFVLAFYWLTELPLIKRLIFSFIREDRRARGRLLWDSVEEKLGAWVRGQLILMLFIGVLASIGYSIMGLKYAFALAVFAGLAEVIPLVGPYIGGAPAVLIALTQSPTLAIIVAVYIVVIQLVEGNVLVPRIMQREVGVTPLTVILGILIGSTLLGIGGALLAVPIAAAVQVVFNNILSFSSDASTPQAEAAATNTPAAVNAAAQTQEVKTLEHDKGGSNLVAKP